MMPLYLSEEQESKVREELEHYEIKLKEYLKMPNHSNFGYQAWLEGRIDLLKEILK